MSDLLPCPFCGGEAGKIADATRILGTFNLIHRCPVIGPVKIELATQEGVIAIWNTRAPTQAQEAALTDTAMSDQPGTAEAFPDTIQIFRRDRKMTFGDHVNHDPNDWQSYIRADAVQAQIDAAVRAERER